MESELPNLPDEDDEDEDMSDHGAKHSKGKPRSANIEYLRTLVESEHKSIDQFDKTVLALAGGSFAVSFAFLKDIVKPEVVTHKGWLMLAWACWSLSLFSTLASFYFSHLAMRTAQRQFQNGIRDETVLGGNWSRFTNCLTPASGVVFIVGLLCMSIFVTNNLSYEHGTPTTTTNSTPTAAGSAATTSQSTTGNAPTGNAPSAKSDPGAPGHTVTPR